MDEKDFLSDLDFCVIDTETTGGNAKANRIIDVAVFRFKNGEVVEKFQSLVNPGRPIPTWITMLTGIDDDMVQRAPAFSDIAGPLRDILGRGIFTAHNSGFDYGFITEEFRRIGVDYASPQCCTLKLARLLLPELHSRSLGVLCEHFLIDIWDRHRAFGDAEATVYVLKNILNILKKDHQVETWAALERFVHLGALHLPKGINYQHVNQLPDKPGFYIFKDADGKSILSGKVSNIRRRIKSYFKKTNTSEKSNRLRNDVKFIEFILHENTRNIVIPAKAGIQS